MNNFPIALKNRDYRKDAAQEAALRKLKELRGEGLPLTRIAKDLGVSAQFVGMMLKDEDPKPVSRKVWEAMVAKGWVAAPGSPAVVAPAQTETVANPPTSESVALLFQKAQELYKAHERLLGMYERQLSRYDGLQDKYEALQEKYEQLRAERTARR